MVFHHGPAVTVLPSGALGLGIFPSSSRSATSEALICLSRIPDSNPRKSLIHPLAEEVFARIGKGRSAVRRHRDHVWHARRIAIFYKSLLLFSEESSHGLEKI